MSKQTPKPWNPLNRDPQAVKNEAKAGPAQPFGKFTTGKSMEVQSVRATPKLDAPVTDMFDMVEAASALSANDISLRVIFNELFRLFLAETTSVKDKLAIWDAFERKLKEVVILNGGASSLHSKVAGVQSEGDSGDGSRGTLASLRTAVSKASEVLEIGEPSEFEQSDGGIFGDAEESESGSVSGTGHDEAESSGPPSGSDQEESEAGGEEAGDGSPDGEEEGTTEGLEEQDEGTPDIDSEEVDLGASGYGVLNFGHQPPTRGARGGICRKATG